MTSHLPIALIGYRGTGKTTVAQRLALRLQYDWVDADVEIELRAGKSIAEIFQQSGEVVFRDLETQKVVELCRRQKTILALGGGAVLAEENRQAIATCGAVVWLRASAETIAGRLAADPTTASRRPNLINHGGRNEIDILLAGREPIYQACATVQVDTENKDPAQIVDEIIASLQVGEG